MKKSIRQKPIRNLTSDFGLLQNRDDEYCAQERKTVLLATLYVDRHDLGKDELLDLIEMLDLEAQIPAKHRRRRTLLKRTRGAVTATLVN